MANIFRRRNPFWQGISCVLACVLFLSSCSLDEAIAWKGAEGGQGEQEASSESSNERQDSYGEEAGDSGNGRRHDGAESIPADSPEETDVPNLDFPMDVENNGANFVRILDKVYFRHYGEAALGKISLWGDFSSLDGGKETKMLSYDLERGTVEEVFDDAGSGAIWYAEGGFLLTVKKGENSDSSLVRISLDGKKRENLGDGTVKGVSDDGKIAAVWNNAEERLYLYKEGAILSGVGLEDASYMEFCGLAGEDMVFYRNRLEDGEISFWQMSGRDGSVLCLGTLPRDEDEGNEIVVDFIRGRGVTEPDESGEGGETESAEEMDEESRPVADQETEENGGIEREAGPGEDMSEAPGEAMERNAESERGGSAEPGLEKESENDNIQSLKEGESNERDSAEAGEISEINGTNVYVRLLADEGEGRTLSRSRLARMTIGKENSLVTMEIPEGKVEEGGGGSVLSGKRMKILLSEDGELQAAEELPVEFELSEKKFGDLLYWSEGEEPICLQKNLIAEDPFETGGRLAHILQATEAVAGRAFAMMADIRRNEESDIGWRQAYRLENLACYCIPLEKDGGITVIDTGIGQNGGGRHDTGEGTGQAGNGKAKENMDVYIRYQSLADWIEGGEEFSALSDFQMPALGTDYAKNHPALESRLLRENLDLISYMNQSQKTLSDEAREMASSGSEEASSALPFWKDVELFLKRADGTVISYLLEDTTYSNGNERSLFSARCFDVKTGNALRLSDVFEDIEDIPGLLADRIRRYYPDAPGAVLQQPETSETETSQPDFEEGVPPETDELGQIEMAESLEESQTASENVRDEGDLLLEDLRSFVEEDREGANPEFPEQVGETDGGKRWIWTLDPQGVTFYFNEDSLAYGNQGLIQVPVFFSEDTEGSIFSEEFRKEETQWTMYLPEYYESFFDIGQDGRADRLQVSMAYPEDPEGTGELLVRLNGREVREKSSAGKRILFYSNGRAYLYAECKPMEGETEGTIKVFDLNSRNVRKIMELPGEFYDAPSENEDWNNDSGAPMQVIVTPLSFSVERMMSLFSAFPAVLDCGMARDGMPEPYRKQYEYIDYHEVVLKYEITVPLLELEDGMAYMTSQSVKLKEGERMLLRFTDDREYVDLQLEDGRLVRIYMRYEQSDGSRIAEGKEIRELFDGIVLSSQGQGVENPL